jgi:hypothetical protein
LELKIDTGLDRTLNALVGWVRTVLSTDQKKTDFNPPMLTGSNKHAGMGLAQASPACLRVVKFVNHQVFILCFDSSKLPTDQTRSPDRRGMCVITRASLDWRSEAFKQGTLTETEGSVRLTSSL